MNLRTPSLFLLFVLTGLGTATLRGFAAGPSFQLPTANDALLAEGGGGERYFVGTVGKPWPSGTFGCVRTDGMQLHEGLDIRALHRDKKGEPTDPVLATADGTVAYVSLKTGLSNYGRYVVIRHEIDGIEIYSLYAHLASIRAELKAGDAVKAGEQIGVMGRSTNTAQPISKERAHVHFELNLVANDNFPAWYQATFPGQRNDHGKWNGQNLMGLDPQKLFLAQKTQGASFNLRQFIRSEEVLCRVLIRTKTLPFATRYSGLTLSNPLIQTEGVAGYEISLNFNGVPTKISPRAASEIGSGPKFQLLSVNAAEQTSHPCRKLVTRQGAGWRLTERGSNHLRLLSY